MNIQDLLLYILHKIVIQSNLSKINKINSYFRYMTKDSYVIVHWYNYRYGCKRGLYKFLVNGKNPRATEKIVRCLSF